ncbi:putative methylesterase 11 [Colletotrichum siamense]|nr:putative methylesterase 11 [Colletotrichum siamense]
MATKPTFIFVPGAWHCATRFRPVTSQLEALGYNTVSVQLPSYGANPPLKDFEPDVAAIREAIGKAVDNSEEVVLFMHSYGGVVGSEACRGLDTATRKREGKPGGIFRLIFCAAFLLPEGVSLIDMLQGQPLPWFRLSENDTIVDAERPVEICYNDLDEEAAAEAVLGLKCHSYRTFFSKLTYAAWRDIPVTYILCERDNAIPPPAQQQMIDASKVDVVVERMDASHSPFLSRPNDVTAALRRSAGEVF